MTIDLLRITRVGCAGSVLLAALGLGPSLQAEPLLPQGELEVPPPLSPAESLAAISVPEGMRVELVAAEPDVMDPIAIDWGPDGRMWVVEMADYPLGMDGEGAPGGRIRVLESSRGDGVFDRSTLFASGLRFPTSVKVWRRGILVTAAPEVLYLEDTNGDGRADVRRVVFSGLGIGNEQHMANGMRWGLDGWLHLANGVTKGKIISSQTGEVVSMTRDARIRPDEAIAEPLYGLSQYGRKRDDWGNWFGNNNTHPARHFALEERYLSRNPHFAPPSAVIEVSAVPQSPRVYPLSRTLERFNSAGGYNHITSSCSTMVWRDVRWGDEYYGNLLVCEPVHNLVHRQVVERRGTTFRSDRAPSERESEFLASADNWARFSNLSTGPDGALYVVDMYRFVIEHPQYIPPEWMELIDPYLRVGEDRGRIYRVFPAARGRETLPRLDQQGVEDWVATLEHGNGTRRDLAQQLLYWGNHREAAPSIRRLLHDTTAPQARVTILSTLDLLDVLKPYDVRVGLADASPWVRRYAVRVSDRLAESAPDLLRDLAAMVDDPDPSVRQQLAYSMGQWKASLAGETLAHLLAAETDPLLRAAALSSFLPHRAVVVRSLPVDAAPIPELSDMLVATGDNESLEILLARIGDMVASGHEITAIGWAGNLLSTMARNNLGQDGISSENQRVLLELAARARERALDPAFPLPERTQAVNMLGFHDAQFDADLDALGHLLAPEAPDALAEAAIGRLEGIDDERAGPLLVDAWIAAEPGLESKLLDLLISRPKRAELLGEKLAADRGLLDRIDTAHRQALERALETTRPGLVSKLADEGSNLGRQAVVEAYLRDMQSLDGDAQRGRTVYAQVCAACHRFGTETGVDIGPDLASLANRSPSYLTVHILDPNRMVADQYRLYTVTTRDGRHLTGMIAAESSHSINLRQLNGIETVVLRGEIETLKDMGQSLMPDGLEAAMSAQDMVDLVEFLSTN